MIVEKKCPADANGPGERQKATSDKVHWLSHTSSTSRSPTVSVNESGKAAKTLTGTRAPRVSSGGRNILSGLSRISMGMLACSHLYGIAYGVRKKVDRSRPLPDSIRASLSRTLSRLETNGLIERIGPSRGLAALTDSGRELAATFPFHENIMRHLPKSIEWNHTVPQKNRKGISKNHA